MAIKKRITLKKISIIFIFAIFIINFIKQEITIRRIQEDIVISQEQLDELQEKNSKLEEELQNINSEEEQERLVRERLGMIKEGEKVVNFNEQD